jgi:hypothetical protein
MAKLSTFRRLFKSEFKKEYHDLIEKLIVSINNGFDTVYDALNNKLTLKNNILCNVKDFTVRVNSNGEPITPLLLAVSFKNNITVVTLGKITNNTNFLSYPTTGVTISWEQQSVGFLKINHITGLIPENEYNIRVVVYGDEN